MLNQFNTSAFVNLISAIAALCAVIIAVASEIRAQKRFKLDTELQREIATANNKPILDVEDTETDEEKELILANQGVGTALVTNLVFSRGNSSGPTLPSVIKIEKQFEWDLFLASAQRFAVRPGAKIKLAHLTKKGLSQQGLANTDVDELFRQVSVQARETKISVEFEDIFGNKQPRLDYTLHP